MTKKENFLSEHNKLSPVDLQATMALLSLFKTEKGKIFKDNEWSVEKLRRPFIFWLTSLSMEDRKKINQQS